MSDIVIGSAGASDLPAILDLLREQKLPAEGLSDHLETTLIAREDGQVVGCIAIEMYADGGLLRCVAVAASMQGRGLGRSLTDAAVALDDLTVLAIQRTRISNAEGIDGQHRCK